MTSLPPSGSNERVSGAFERLHPKVQRWVYERSWDSLRDIQEESIDAILNGNGDVLISAATAAGKTEAAFLPICSLIARAPVESVAALYISPLKALINDQFQRVDLLCESLDIPVTRWHGDVAASVKHGLVKRPKGILLTTPESLEAIFVRQGAPVVRRMFAHLSHVVVDELHAFIGNERGQQLLSLLHRLDITIGSAPARIGLSATLGDMDLAAGALRPGHAESVRVIVSRAGGQDLLAQIRGYVEKVHGGHEREVEQTDSEGDLTGSAVQEIAEHIYRSLRGSNNLIFANSRRNVELYAAALSDRCERDHIPNSFFPHHGSLSKELRENVEARLKAGDLPVNAVATSTLELGIDIGAVASVAQIGSPWHVSSLRQRVGRSGRRGQAAVLRMYATEHAVAPNSDLLDSLRFELVECMAILRLLLDHWCEPPDVRGTHFSTLVQQILSTLAAHGGAGAPFMWKLLCETGPFTHVTKPGFMHFLRGLGKQDLISQATDGTLHLGMAGERLVNHYTFYAAFATPDEYRLLHEGRPLGTMPVVNPLAPDEYVIFAGKRWKVVDIDTERKVIQLTPAFGGRVPPFDGIAGLVHDRVRAEMRAVYRETTLPSYLDPVARNLLAEARDTYRRLDLDRTHFMSTGGTDANWFHWAGDRIAFTLTRVLAQYGRKCMSFGPALRVYDTTADDLTHILAEVAGEPAPDPVSLIESIPEKRIEKYDAYVPEDLLAQGFAASRLDVPGAMDVVRAVTAPADA